MAQPAVAAPRAPINQLKEDTGLPPVRATALSSFGLSLLPRPPAPPPGRLDAATPLRAEPRAAAGTARGPDPRDLPPEEGPGSPPTPTPTRARVQWGPCLPETRRDREPQSAVSRGPCQARQPHAEPGVAAPGCPEPARGGVGPGAARTGGDVMRPFTPLTSLHPRPEWASRGDRTGRRGPHGWGERPRTTDSAG